MNVFFSQLSSYDIVSNLTGRNISDYLMKTTKDFNKRRYGGFEFGVGNPLAGKKGETWGFPVGKLGSIRLPVMVYISV